MSLIWSYWFSIILRTLFHINTHSAIILSIKLKTDIESALHQALPINFLEVEQTYLYWYHKDKMGWL